MTRVAYTDLKLMFTPHASTSYPIINQITGLITDLYREAYRIMYPREPDKYSSDDSKDTYGIIDVGATFSVIKKQADTLVDDWHLSGEDEPKPEIEFEPKYEKQLVAIASNSHEPYWDTFRLYGNESSDWEGIY